MELDFKEVRIKQKFKNIKKSLIAIHGYMRKSPRLYEVQILNELNKVQRNVKEVENEINDSI